MKDLQWLREFIDASLVADVIKPGQVGRFKVSERLLNVGYWRRNGITGDVAILCSGMYSTLEEIGYEEGFGGTHWMTDAPHELLQQKEFDDAMCGDVLIGGLGLGVIARRACMKPTVKSVTVIELEKDVVRLVGDPLRAKFGSKLRIIPGDVHTLDPAVHGRRFDWCWLDIWPTINVKNLPEFLELEKKYSRFCKNIRFWSLNEICAKLDLGVKGWNDNPQTAGLMLMRLSGWRPPAGDPELCVEGGWITEWRSLAEKIAGGFPECAIASVHGLQESAIYWSAS